MLGTKISSTAPDIRFLGNRLLRAAFPDMVNIISNVSRSCNYRATKHL